MYVVLVVQNVYVHRLILMAYNESRKKASIEYAKRSLKRIPLDVQKEKYDEIKAAADKAGETVNGYIKKAIEQRMENENGSVE